MPSKERMHRLHRLRSIPTGGIFQFEPLFALLLIVLFTFGPADGIAEDEQETEAPTRPPMTWYASSVVTGDSGFRVTHYWSKGSSMRAETMIGAHPIVTIVRGDRYWIYDELHRQGLEITRSPAAVEQDAKRGRPFANDFENLMKQH